MMMAYGEQIEAQNGHIAWLSIDRFKMTVLRLQCVHTHFRLHVIYSKILHRRNKHSQWQTNKQERSVIKLKYSNSENSNKPQTEVQIPERIRIPARHPIYVINGMAFVL